jgi:phospholipid/cholesterol/gamma-HCH transport system substrate-binding protein
VGSRFHDAWEKSFLERNQRLIGLIGVVALVAGSAFALLLSGGIFARTYHVTAFFSDAAGIAPGDRVTVAGLPAGTVKSMRIERGQVAMDLAVSSGVKLPADSRAEIVIQTLLGKEVVQLVAGQSEQQLRGGSVISLDRTTTPVSITQLNDISVNLLQHSDAKAFNDFLAEVTKVTTGEGQQVRTLVAGLADLSAAVDSRRTQLAQLLTSLRKLSTTLGERSGTIVALIDNLDPVLQNLAARQRDIQTLLVATASGSHATADLVQRNRKVLDQTLASLHDDLGVIDQHQVDLASTITYLRTAVLGYQSVGYSQGTPNQWANIFVQSLGPAGVDAVLGKCGALDRLIDQLLATDCNKEPGANQPGGGGKPLPLPSLPPLPTPSLPPLPSPSVPPVPSPTLSIPPLPTPGAPHGPAQFDSFAAQSYWDELYASSSQSPQSLDPAELGQGAFAPGLPQTFADLFAFALFGTEPGPR